jgi:hypothetical protein
MTKFEHGKEGNFDQEMDFGTDLRLTGYRRIQDCVSTDPIALEKDLESPITGGGRQDDRRRSMGAARQGAADRPGASGDQKRPAGNRRSLMRWMKL